MQISTGSVDITPETSIPLAGYFQRKGEFVSINDRLEANFVLFKTKDGIVAIVSIDALFGSDALRDLILKATGNLTTILSLILVASHTHFAPSLDPGKPRLGLVDESHLHTIARKIGSKISEVSETGHWQSAQLRKGEADCNLSIYRRSIGLSFSKSWPYIRRCAVLSPNVKIAHPTTLDLICAETKSGEPLFVLWSWPCHAVSQSDGHAVSADFPGAVRGSLRKCIGDEHLPVLYFPGFAGDIRPFSKRSALSPRSFLKYPFSFLPTFKPNTIESYQALCRGVSEAAISAFFKLGASLYSPEPMSYSFVEIPLTKIIDDFQAEHTSTQLSHDTMRISLIENDLISILLMGAETCSTYTQQMPDVSQPIILRTGYSHECFGYLPTDQQIAEGGLEGDWFFHRFSLSGKFKPKIQNIIVSAISNLYQSHSVDKNDSKFN